MPTLAEVLRQTGYSQDGTLAAPASNSPMTTALSEHIKSLPQKFQQNQAEQMALLGQAFPGNTYKSMMTEGDPKAMAELAMQVPFNALTAYHGTPHKIKGAFDISKVGTGEGAQAYGHGIYFAENPVVAKEYQKLDPAGGPTLPPRRILNGQELEPGTPEYHAGTLLSRNGVTLKSARDMVKSWIDDPTAMSAGEKTVEGWKKTLDTLNSIPKKSSFKELPHEGNLYKVDIPDEHIPNMLDWDKPLNQQPKNVKEYFTKRGYTNDNWSAPSFIKNEGDPAEVSAILHEAGIPGIRYLDQGSRTPGFSSLTPTQLESRIASLQTDIKSGAGNTQKMKDQLKGLQNELDSYKNMTSNFVVFDPSTVKILEENGKPLTRKELIEKQVKDLKD